MATDLSLLKTEFRIKVEEGLAKCKAQGLEMRPIFTIRTPLEQAKLWRQSRTIEQIQQKITALQAAGAHYLATCIQAAGAQNGPRVTGVGPGFSWHQWGEAVDCMWVKNGKAEWNDLTGYKQYAVIMKGLGLRVGADFSSPDFPHVQFRQEEISSLYSVKEVNDEMEKRFA